jgi:hypothetical protein
VPTIMDATQAAYPLITPQDTRGFYHDAGYYL